MKMKKAKPAPQPNFPNSRKALRKQKRQEKKVKRVEHYSNVNKKKSVSLEQPKYTPGRFVKRPPDVSDNDVKVKNTKQKVQQPTAYEILSNQRRRDIKETDKLKNQMEEQRKKIFQEANEGEDKIIKKLEKQLGLNKTKNKNNFFADDGLDYLLEICDRTTSEQIVAAEKHLANVEDESDFEEDLAVVTGKKVDNKKKKSTISQSETEDEDNSDGESENEEASDNELSSAGDEIEDNEEIEGKDFPIESSEISDDDDNDEDIEPPQKKSKPNIDKNNKNPESNVEKSKKKSNKVQKNNENDDHKDDLMSGEEIENPFSDDEVSHLSGDEDLDGFDENGDKADEVKNEENSDVWEDIYGRKRDKEGNIIKEEIGVYIPPHLRNKDSGSDKELAQLKRQIKSVLNKLAGTNLHWACTSIENLYSNNSRNSVNVALTSLWMEATVSESQTPDRLVAEHVAMLATLHANVGQEIGAHFLQVLVNKFDEMLMMAAPVEDKKLDNLMCCLSYMYSFKLYQADLLYDMLRRLLDSVTEKSIECILVTLRCAGAALRKDQPLALKNFIHHTQNIVSTLDTDNLRSRISFLQEVLMAVKNNNLTKIPKYDPSYTEQLRKNIKTVIRKGNYITPLNIRLEDLLKAEERGKWWVVGSAWEGAAGGRGDGPAVVKGEGDEKLLALARAQRMNTDVRRSIFCIIMAAEDYMDAFEKLQQLGLKGHQQREIVHVLLACSLQERTYNPYYAVLAHKLCLYDRKYLLSIQYTIWDKIKDLESLSKQSVTNLAQFLIHLIMEKSLPLSVLKVIEFSDLNKSSVRFMRQILLAIIMNTDLQAALQVFHRVSKSAKLHMFRESLRLFIQHFLLKSAGKKTSVLSEEEMSVLRERTLEVDKLLTMHDSKLRF